MIEIFSMIIGILILSNIVMGWKLFRIKRHILILSLETEMVRLAVTELLKATKDIHQVLFSNKKDIK